MRTKQRDIAGYIASEPDIICFKIKAPNSFQKALFIGGVLNNS